MANEFYTHSGYPSTGSAGSSSALRAELDALQAAFDKLPGMSANAGRFVAVNSGGTALVPVTSLSVDVSGNVTLTGNLTAAALIPSSATVPTTGFYLPSAGAVGVATSGLARASFPSTGGLLLNAPTSGQVLTAVGTSYFQGAAAAGTVLSILPDPASGVNGVTISSTFATGGYGPINFQTSATTRLSIAAAGLVTIANGLTITASGLTVSAGGASIVGGITNTGGVISSTATDSAGNAGWLQLRNTFSTAVNKFIRVGTSSNLEVVNSGNTAVLFGLSDTGNTTITSSAGTGLAINVATNNNVINASDGTTGSVWYSGGGNVILGTVTAHQLLVYTSNTSRIAISAAGNVGVNAPSSGAALTVTGAAVTSGALVVNAGASTGEGMTLYASTVSYGASIVGRASDNSSILRFVNNAFSLEQGAIQSTPTALNLNYAGTTRVSIASGGAVTVIAPTSGNALTVNGNAYTPASALTWGATLTVNAQLSNLFYVTLTGNTTTFTISNMQDGQTINIFFTQDATGSRTLAWSGVKFPGGSAPALSTAANAVDLAVITNRGGVFYGSLSKAFA